MINNIRIVETYFKDILGIYMSGAGVKETSYYSSLDKLFNAIGKDLKPQIKFVLQLANHGAGSPDGGLFTKEQWDTGNEQAPLLGQIPARGVVEIKSPSDDTWLTVDSKQVSKYWTRYQLVLVTNYRDFVIVGRSRESKPVILESCRLATSEADFWSKVNHPQKFAQEIGNTFVEYLRRTMLHAAPITSPKDLAWFLASYARTASARIEGKDIPAMKSVRSALEAALGLKFEGAKGEHFFHSTLVQTIFYGVFSAWVLWHKRPSRADSDTFNWHDALWELKVPVMQALFGQIVTPEHIGPLDFEDILDWTTSTLNRVDRPSFFSAFEEDKAVQYFYEPFLEAFDPELRKQLGVWFTPPEIVKYMVSRVDTVLREELHITDGLADPSVYVLDPCCGTGSYLIEVVKHIHRTLQSKGADALLANDLKQAALKRVLGFEILPAPFVVSHMQLGLTLHSLGAPLSDALNERAGVYLTNALTGWDPLDLEKEKAFQTMLTGFPQLLEEQSDARKVKQQVPILVILGNPPYNAFSGTAATKEERESIAPFKEGLIKEWGIKKFNLDELYVRFFRMAERRITEQTGRGVVCLISNYSYLSEPSFVVIRQRFSSEFDRIWIDNLNGDSRETGKRTPDGKPDPSVFSTDYNKAGIRVGTAVSLLVRQYKRDKPLVRYRQFWGLRKRSDLLSTLTATDINSQYQFLQPTLENRYSFRPSDVSAGYLLWPKLIDIASRQPFAGLSEDRRKALMGIERQPLKERMQKYYATDVSWEELESLKTCLTTNVPRFKAKEARETVRKAETFDESRLLHYAMRPFDLQWCYYSPVRPLWREPRPDYWSAFSEGTPTIVTRFKSTKQEEGSPIAFARHLCDYHMMPPNSSIIPFLIHSQLQNNDRKPKEQAHLLKPEANGIKANANLSASARRYLASLGFANPDLDLHIASLIWMHVLAISYSPAYLSENTDGIRKDWPRIPLPVKKQALEFSAALGEKICALLDAEKPVLGVTTTPLSHEMQLLAVIKEAGGGQLQPKDLGLTSGWGHAGQNGVVMPGKGKVVQRGYTADEEQSLLSGVQQLAISSEKSLQLLGDRTFDIYLNDVAYWRNVPVNVWSYTIGGYQVIKKWLSYRENSLLGRALTTEEVREVTNMVRRIAAIILLQPELDKNYYQCKENAYPWPGETVQ